MVEAVLQGVGRLGRVTAGVPLLLGARWDELERYGSGGRVQVAWWWCQGWVAEVRKGWLVFGLPPGKEKGAGCGGFSRDTGTGERSRDAGWGV